MPSVRACFSGGTLTPFLYPAFTESTLLAVSRTCPLRRRFQLQARCNSTATEQPDISRLDPTPDDYSLTPFADRAILTLEAGAGGHGCVSFLREMFTPEGPANGGDGGSGGNIYIQAVRGETSLHKLARRRLIRAGRGRNGQGKVKGGERGADVLIKVPVGTIVREIQRHDPVEILLEEAEKAERERERAEANGDVVEEDGGYKKDRWLVYPGTVPTELNRMKFPQLPKPRRSHLAALEPQSPLWLDLDKHMETPMLLAAGAMGGLGNPNFMTPFNNRPKMATRGEEGLKISVQLELKILADLGLVGLPNAGKSTLLRALSNSRARVGNWAFTTLQPNVGTVVLDNHKGRPLVTKRNKHGELRESFTIADVPGLIEDAHLDKGLGLGFLRHIERAAVLAFVIDLNAGDAVAALKLLWREVSEYETQRGKELNAETERRMVTWMPANRAVEAKSDVDELDIPDLNPNVEPLPFLASEPISAKPWFVVATKADLDGTQENYESLHKYLQDVKSGAQPHPSGKENSWKRDVSSIPISAINAHGVEAIPQIVMDLLDD